MAPLAPGALIVLSGCPSDGALDRDGYGTPAASCGFGADAVDALRAALAADWVGLRGRYVVDAGVSCAAATDAAGCRSQIEALSMEVANPPAGDGWLLAINRGDAVLVHGRDGNVLVPIDSPLKAFFTVAARWSVTCQRWVRETRDGFEVIGTTTTSDCDPVITSEQRVLVKGDGTTFVLDSSELSRQDGVCIGRRPEGLLPLADREPSALADYFARAAYLEAASVHAFVRLRAELLSHGAPRRLAERAAESAHEEVRHARLMQRLARRFGARPPPSCTPRPMRRRTLLEFAIENAVEGCVRETFGAVEAAMQSLRAGDVPIRDTMRTIARDELRHATLAWEIDAWVRRGFDERERSLVDVATREAAAELGREIDAHAAVSPMLAAAAGLPSVAAARRAHAVLDALLWGSTRNTSET
jgi:hypothetical protein